MSADLDLTPTVRSWLHDQDRPLSGDVRERVLDQLPTTPQRRARWPAWRLNTMATPIRIAAAAAIGVFAVVGGIVPGALGPGTPNLMESPSPGPSPAPLNGRTGPLVEGTYRGPLGDGPEQWSVTVPDGWEEFYGILWSDLGVPGTNEDVGGPGEVAMGWESPVNVFTDPCHWKDSLADPPVGLTVDDLATAFVEGISRDVSGPTDVIFGGYPAKKVELSMPADLDVTTCDQGQYRVFLSAGESLEVSDATGTPDLGRLFTVLYILDVDGTRSVMQTWHRADSSLEDLAELEAILASVRIDSPAPGADPSATPEALAWSPASLEQDWPAPVRAEPAGDALVVPLNSPPLDRHVDPAGDTGSDVLPWTDIVQVSSVSSDHMYLQLAKRIPTPVADPSERWMAYGLVLDVDDDGVADVRLGIDNLPVAEGGHRAWRTDLHTGRTESAAGAPYGDVGDSYFDTFYPGESLPYGPVGSARFGFDEGTTFRFYAWASVIEDGRVVATDYAPDSGWLVAAPSN